MSQRGALARSIGMLAPLSRGRLALPALAALAALVALDACLEPAGPDPLCACGATADPASGGARAEGPCGPEGASPEGDRAAAPRVEPWPEAERLFDGDPRWLGAGGARSVAIDGDRVLWLFAESLVGRADGSDRRDALTLHNEAAVQHGRDPRTARLEHALGPDGGAPLPFLADDGEAYFWPGAALRVRTSLLLTFLRIRPATGGLGFEVDGQRAIRVDDASGAPETWTLHEVRLPPASTGVLFTSHLMVHEGFVLAYGFAEPRHTMLLARWPEQRAIDGDLGAPEWWTGRGWSGDVAARAPVLEDGQTDLTVTALRGREGFFVLQAAAFGAVPLVLRAGPTPTGPFLPPVTIHSPRERDLPGMLVHGVVAHPALTTGDTSLVLSYVVTSLDRERTLTDRSLHTPRLLRVVP